jgi:ABC-type Mn2+/Zn2+ transport system permease subunit
VTEWLAWLAEPFAYPFMQRGLAAAVTVGVVGPVLGAYVVVRGMAFFGDALAHIILPGVVVAFLLGWPLVTGALLVGIAAALAIGAISRRSPLKEDAAIGVVFAGCFALGIVLLSARRGYAVDLAHILFGNLLGVSAQDLVLIILLGGLALVTVFLHYKEFLALSFDPLLATTLRLPVRRLQNLMLVLLAVVIVTSIQAVGVALVLAMLITPAASASLLTRRFPTMMVVGAGIGVASAVVGLYLSYYGDLPSGPAIVLAATAMFFVAFIFGRRRARA